MTTPTKTTRATYTRALLHAVEAGADRLEALGYDVSTVTLELIPAAGEN